MLFADVREKVRMLVARRLTIMDKIQFFFWKDEELSACSAISLENETVIAENKKKLQENVHRKRSKKEIVERKQ
jgi:hypothetical protein